MLKKYTPKKDREEKKLKPFWKKFLFWFLTISVSLFALGAITLAVIIAIFSAGLPDVTDLENHNQAEATEILDSEGNVIYTIFGEENREYVDLENVSQSLIDATIAIEDDEFYEHSGFDIWAIGRALLSEVGIGRARGGSTLTQQYVKNTFLSNEQTYDRKIKELILSTRMERNFTKDEILELYLNRIPYGNNAYGIQKAAEVYFDKDAADLNLAESALLAGLPQRPTQYNPLGEHSHSHLLKAFTPEELEIRTITSEFDLELDEYVRGAIGQYVDLGNGESIYIAGRSDIVLDRMVKTGYINEEEQKAALEELQSIEFNDYRVDIEYEHFVFYVQDYLAENYDEAFLQGGGLKIYTTIDPNLQNYAEELAKDRQATNLNSYGANNIGILTINPKNGAILAMVGSADYYDETIEGENNMTTAFRQPGSSFKPIGYAQAFNEGYAPGTVVYDVPTKIGSARPQNYEGGFRGKMTLRSGLAQSRNITAIKAYYVAGEQDAIIPFAEDIGITSLDIDHDYGYPLILGAGEVPMTQMATAYGTFANNGKKPELTPILKIENSDGEIIEEIKNIDDFEEVMDPQVAYLINDILSDRSVSLGPNVQLPNHIAAAKTGTSTKQSKAGGGSVRPGETWTIGYTPSYVTAVLVANTDGTGLNYNANGYDVAAPVWKAMMNKALEEEASEPFPRPEGITEVKISKYSGKLPAKGSPTITEIFPSFSIPTEVEKVTSVKVNKNNGFLATDNTPPDAIETITAVACEPIADLFNWKNEIKGYCKNGGSVPTEQDPTPENAGDNPPSITITSPGNQTVVDGGFNASVSVTAPNGGVTKVEYYLDDVLKFTATSAPFSGYIGLSGAPGSEHFLTAKVYDNYYITGQSSVRIRLAGDGEEPDENLDPDEEVDDPEEPLIFDPPDDYIDPTQTPDFIPESFEENPESTPPNSNDDLILPDSTIPESPVGEDVLILP